MQETYAEKQHLMLGDMSLGRAVDPEKYLMEASEDVDITIGQVYEMPFDITAPNAPKHTVILLRRIVSRLASGRLILAQAIGTEDQQLQAYGKHLIDEANSVIDAIVEGRIEFEGPTPIEGSDAFTGPTISNHDAASAVDSFYSEFMTPISRPVPRTGPVWQPGG